MGIQQDRITPTGEAKGYHRLGGSFEKGSPLFVTVNSYPDKAARDSGACPWMEPVVIPWEEWRDIYDAIVDCTDRTGYGAGQYWTGSEFMSVAEAIENGII